ncbi:MAG: hypothetical protein IRZ33_06000 [Alicyclobacillaceae bacterium]|nr:hypothetical protein [Alicyclobacillaceae bacterium]
MEKLQAFLDELSELTKRYGLIIGGCGCCGSPYVYGDDAGGDHLQWNSEEQCYYLITDADPDT